jgi:hypothetical protein
VHLLLVPEGERRIFDAPHLFDPLLITLKIIVGTMAASAMVRSSTKKDGLFMGFAMCSAASLLITDLSWMMRFIWNFVTIAALLYIMASVQRRAALIAVFIISVPALVLNGSFIWMSMFQGRLVGVKSIFLGGVSLHALLALFIITAYFLYESSWSPVVEQSYSYARQGMKKLIALKSKK